MVWILPVGKGKRFMGSTGPGMDRLVGGWSTSLLTYLASGRDFSPQVLPALILPTPAHSGGLPDLVGDPNNVPGGKNYPHGGSTQRHLRPRRAAPSATPGRTVSRASLCTRHIYLSRRVWPSPNTGTPQLVHQDLKHLQSPAVPESGGDISVPGGNEFTSQYGTFDSLESGQQRQITFLGGFTF